MTMMEAMEMNDMASVTDLCFVLASSMVVLPLGSKWMNWERVAMS